MLELLENIRRLCKRLGLHHIASGDVPLYDVPKEALVKLELALMMEVNFMDERRYNVLKGRSHLPPLKTFEEFDYKFQPIITFDLVDKFKDPSWIMSKFNMIFIGKGGTGKTHIATAIGHHALRNGIKVFYADIPHLLYYLKTHDTIGKSKTKLGYLYHCELVILDEFGYEPVSSEDAMLIYNTIKKINYSASLIIVTNRMFDQWPSIFGDGIMTNTLIDRLIQKCQIINFGSNSYRVETHVNLFTEDEPIEDDVPVKIKRSDRKEIKRELTQVEILAKEIREEMEEEVEEELQIIQYKDIDKK